LKGTGKQVSILTRSRQEATERCAGCVQTAPKVNHPVCGKSK